MIGCFCLLRFVIYLRKSAPYFTVLEIKMNNSMLLLFGKQTHPRKGKVFLKLYRFDIATNCVFKFLCLCVCIRQLFCFVAKVTLEKKRKHLCSSLYHADLAWDSS